MKLVNLFFISALVLVGCSKPSDNPPAIEPKGKFVGEKLVVKSTISVPADSKSANVMSLYYAGSSYAKSGGDNTCGLFYEKKNFARSLLAGTQLEIISISWSEHRFFSGRMNPSSSDEISCTNLRNEVLELYGLSMPSDVCTNDYDYSNGVQTKKWLNDNSLNIVNNYRTIILVKSEKTSKVYKLICFNRESQTPESIIEFINTKSEYIGLTKEL